MKSKIYLLTLLVSVGLIAADEPASTAPSNPPAKADNPPAKPGKKKDKGPKAPDGVSDADWKSLLEARKAAATDPAVVAAQAELDTAKKGTDEKAIADAQSKLAEAQKAAVIKAHPELADAANKAAEADKKRAGKSKSHDAGAGKPSNKQ